MSNQKWPRKGRAADARRGPPSAMDLFEQALKSDPEQSHKNFDPRTDRKTLQLCRQVQHAMMLALAGECGDELLRDIYVESVEPAGGSGHLIVRIIVPSHIPIPKILQILKDRTGHLRSVIAATISRKHVPTLSYLPIQDERALNRD